MKQLILVFVLGVAQQPEQLVDNRQVEGATPSTKTILSEDRKEFQFFVSSCGSLFLGYPSDRQVFNICIMNADDMPVQCFKPSNPNGEVVQVDRAQFEYMQITTENEGRPAMLYLGLQPATTDGIDLSPVTAWPGECRGVQEVHKHKGEPYRGNKPKGQ